MKTWVKTLLANQVNYCCTWAVQLKLQMDITMAEQKNISWDIPHVTLVIYPLIPGTALPNNNQHVSDTYF
jgi:hypothetical protein